MGYNEGAEGRMWRGFCFATAQAHINYGRAIAHGRCVMMDYGWLEQEIGREYHPVAALRQRQARQGVVR